jgi:hypothetical protein
MGSRGPKTPLEAGINIYPFLWIEQGKNIASCSRRTVPFAEILDLNQNFAREVAAEQKCNLHRSPDRVDG